MESKMKLIKDTLVATVKKQEIEVIEKLTLAQIEEYWAELFGSDKQMHPIIVEVFKEFCLQ
jgi:predicted metalloprotease